jgi:hypothetical protein
MPTGLPTAFEPTVKAMITYRITGIDNESATLSFIIATDRVEADPTAWSSFSFSGKILR